jgi:hypothetical protein
MLPAGVGTLAAAGTTGLPNVLAGAGRIEAGAGAGAALRTTPGTMGGREGSTSAAEETGAGALVKKFSAAAALLGGAGLLPPRTPPTVEPGAAGIPDGPPREEGGAASKTLLATLLGAALAGAPPNTSAADTFEDEPKYLEGELGFFAAELANRLLGTACALFVLAGGAGTATGFGLGTYPGAAGTPPAMELVLAAVLPPAGIRLMGVGTPFAGGK